MFSASSGTLRQKKEMRVGGYSKWPLCGIFILLTQYVLSILWVDTLTFFAKPNPICFKTKITKNCRSVAMRLFVTISEIPVFRILIHFPTEQYVSKLFAHGSVHDAINYWIDPRGKRRQ